MNPNSLAASIGLSSAEIIGAALVIGFFVIIILALVILTIIALWKIYVKMGRPGWACLIPFYNKVVLLELVGKPMWWIVLLFIPVVNIFIGIIVLRRLAAAFGRGVGFTVGLIFLPFVFFPILGFGTAQYNNIFPPARPMSEAVKWSLIAGLVFMISQSFYCGLLGSSSGPTEPLRILSTDFAYATDGTYVYYSDTIIPNADPDSFKIVENYGVDKNAVYYAGKVVEGADVDTFTADTYVGKDADSVFCDDQAISSADPTTFEFIDGLYAKDANHVYYNCTLVSGADANTFVTETNETNKKPYFDAKDKDHLYYLGEEVKG